MNAFLSYVETQPTLPVETKLAAALSILSHSSITSNLRARSECLRNEITSTLKPQELENAEKLAGDKSAEVLAQEIMK